MLRSKIMIERTLVLTALTASAEVPDFHGRLGIQRDSQLAGARVRLAIELVHFVEDFIGFRDLFQRTAFGNFFKKNPSMLSLLRIVRAQGRSAEV